MVDVIKTSTPYGIFIVTTSLEGKPTKSTESPTPHELRLTLLDTSPVNSKSSKQKIDVHQKSNPLKYKYYMTLIHTIENSWKVHII